MSDLVGNPKDRFSHNEAHTVWSIFFRTNEFREKMESMQEEVHQLDMDIEENQGNCRGKEIKKGFLSSKNSIIDYSLFVEMKLMHIFLLTKDEGFIIVVFGPDLIAIGVRFWPPLALFYKGKLGLILIVLYLL